MMKRFGQKLQLLRKSRGWTQEQLAEQINVSRQALSKWEAGTVVPDTENVFRLSRLFSVSTDDLLDDDRELPQGGREEDKEVAKTGREKNGSPLLRAGGLLALLGAVGMVVLGILASLFPVNYGIAAAAPAGGSGEEVGRVFTGLHAFLAGHDLVWLFYLLAVLTALGLGIVAGWWWKKRRVDRV